MSLRRSTIVAWIYLGYVLILTLYPFEVSHSGLRSFSLSSFFAGLGPRDLVLNILLFIPFGVSVYCRVVIGRTTLSAVLLGTLGGAIVSLLIELLQIFLDRRPSAGDVVANTLGTAIGAVLAAGWPRQFAELGGHLWEKAERSRVLLCVAVLHGVLPFAFSVPQFIGAFRNWNSFFSFQLGNEATFNRPWLGKIHFVALYNRALPANEIAERFHRGFSSGLSKVLPAAGAILLYAFNEAEGEVVHDLSGFESPLDLHISPLDRVQWLGSNGIEILRPAILKSQGAATKLVNAVSETHELSIEMWITPENTMQGGPGRIVSFSLDPWARNFTVGQQGSDIHFRLRTFATGKNSTSSALKTSSGFLRPDTFHIVATYKGGIQKLYSNGVEQPGTLDLSRGGIIGVGAHKTALGYLAYSFFYFAPMSFFCACWFSRLGQTVIEGLLKPFAATTVVLSATEIFQASIFNRTVDGRLIIYSLIVSSIMAITGVVFNRKDRAELLNSAQFIKPTELRSGDADHRESAV